jgi:hypothetical protein
MTKLIARHAKGGLATVVVLGALAFPSVAPAASDWRGDVSGKVHGIGTANTALLNSPFVFDIGRRFH